VTVVERLVAFMREWSTRGVPADVLHEARRLLLNQLKASVGATTHDAVRILHEWGQAADQRGAPATVLWFGGQLGAEQAIMVNGALFEVLDFHDTYIPTFMHATSAVLPAVLAAGELHGSSGRAVLNALAIGMEVELAVATILMPTGYYRGFVPAGLVGGVGAAAGCAVLAGIDAERTANALGLAMCTAFGTYESVGSMALSYITGATARSGFTAFQLAARGLDAPRTAFEGEKGMLSSYSNESADKIDSVLATLGSSWRIHGQTYKTVPTETITHGPIECVLALRERAAGRTVARMRFGVEAIVVKIADERRERFGNPDSELRARFDTRFCAAAAWQRGHFTLDEMRAGAYSDPQILDLRSRIELVADAGFSTFDGAALEITYTDGSKDSIRVPAFLGTPQNRMSDAQLAAVFRSAAQGLLPAERCDAILVAVSELDTASSLRPLLSLLSLH
jgi:2-methylcitrate dehydratase PrpD